MIDERREFLEVLFQNDRFNTLPTHDIDAEEEDCQDLAETFGRRHFDLHLQAKKIDSLQPELPTAMRFASYSEALGTNINSFILKNKVLGRISILSKFSSPEKIASGFFGKELSKLDLLQTTSNKQLTEDTKAEETTGFISGFDPEQATTRQSQSKGLEFTESNSRLMKVPQAAAEAVKPLRTMKPATIKSSSRSLNNLRNKELVFTHDYRPAVLTSNEYWTSRRGPTAAQATETSESNPLETRTLRRLKTQNCRGKQKQVTECKVDCDNFFKDFICKSLDPVKDSQAQATGSRVAGLQSFDE